MISWSVNAARRHCERAAAVSAAVGEARSDRLFTRRIPVAWRPDALHKQERDGMKVVDLRD